MFEKLYDYSQIKGKNIEIIYKGNVPFFNHKFKGICVSNPRLNENPHFDNIMHSLAISVDYLPRFVSTSFYLTINNNEPNNKHTIYIPYRSIESLFVLQPDKEIKLMLFWVAKYNKKIPLDVIRYICEFIDGMEIKVPVVNLVKKKFYLSKKC